MDLNHILPYALLQDGVQTLCAGIHGHDQRTEVLHTEESDRFDHSQLLEEEDPPHPLDRCCCECPGSSVHRLFYPSSRSSTAAIKGYTRKAEQDLFSFFILLKRQEKQSH